MIWVMWSIDIIASIILTDMGDVIEVITMTMLEWYGRCDRHNQIDDIDCQVIRPLVSWSHIWLYVPLVIYMSRLSCDCSITCPTCQLITQLYIPLVVCRADCRKILLQLLPTTNLQTLSLESTNTMDPHAHSGIDIKDLTEKNYKKITKGNESYRRFV